MAQNPNRRMGRAVIVVLAALLLSAGVEGAAVTTRAFADTAKKLWDTKPAKLSLLDQAWLSKESIVLNSLTRVNVLVNRVTKKVEYVWSYKYNRYVRPKFSMPNVQNLYNTVHAKKKQENFSTQQ